MAHTLPQLHALEAALASGELMVQYDGKRVQYRSIAELERAINRVRADLEGQGVLSPPANARGSTTLASFSRD